MARDSVSDDVFLALLGRGEEAIDLVVVWTELTSLLKGKISHEEIAMQMRVLKGQVKNAISDELDVRKKLKAFGRFFSDVAGFRGNAENYAEPENSFVDDVLTRRKGIPISLSLIFCELAKPLKINLEPIAFPGHFLVREKTKKIICDPFSGRVALSQAQCLEIASRVFGQEVAWNDDYMTVATKISIVERMLNNLRNSYSSSGQSEVVRKVEDLIEKVEGLEVPTDMEVLH